MANLPASVMGVSAGLQFRSRVAAGEPESAPAVEFGISRETVGNCRDGGHRFVSRTATGF